MSRVRGIVALVLVLALTSGCILVGRVNPPTPGPSTSPIPVASAEPSLPPRATPTPNAATSKPTATPSPTATPTPAPATPEPTATPAPTTTPLPTATPKPSPTVRPPLAIRLLRSGERLPGDAPDADVARLVHGSTDFALDLLGRVIRGTDDPNVVLGPSSISAAFALLHAGAKGDTAAEIEDVMGFDLPPFRLHAAYNTLDQRLQSRENRKVTVNIVNQLFGQAGYPFEPTYLRIASRQFGAPLATVDYTRKAAAVTKLINRWISDQTNGRIKDVVAPGQLNETTRLVLANATYLKAEWAQKFEKVFTHPAPFRRLDGTRVKVPMMSQQASFPAAFADGYTAVELPYVGDELAMLIVMPDRPSEFLAGLDADGLARIVAGLRTTFRVQGVRFPFVDLTMPRFSARTKVALKPTLIKMGLREAWKAGVADLTGIADPATTREAPLNVSSATHEAWVKVTEKGTEAAAVTVIDVGTGGGEEVPPPTIVLDHPFLWFIRDRETGAILFAGRVTDPSVAAD